MTETHNGTTPVSTQTDFQLNGADICLEGPAEEPLLFALRNRLNLKATRFGCGLEQCGACMVYVDGAARYSCTLPLGDISGKSVVTAEAMAADPIGKALLNAFAVEHAGQCGYCLAGILMSAYALLMRNGRPDRATIVAALDIHLCRCGAHHSILRAVERAAVELASA